MPRLGGVSIYTSFFVSLLLLTIFDQEHFGTIQHILKTDHLLVASFAIIVIVGILDDVYSLSPRTKFFIQVGAGTLAYFGGMQISQITHPSDAGVLQTGFLSFPLTILWIVGVTNAFNLIDGLDGLASGVALIASMTITALALISDNRGPEIALVALALGGAAAGFLPYNFNPAKIFLGDSGSLFLGFTLAVLSIQSSTKGTTAFEILVPLLTLGLPIMDVMLSMTRRFLRSFLPKQGMAVSLFRKLAGMFQADKGHIHHQLVGQGFSQRKVAFCLYIISCLFGAVAFAVTVANGFVSSFILTLAAIAMIGGIKRLGYREMAILKNGMLLPIYQWPVMNRAVFRGSIDLAFIGLAYFGAQLMTSPRGPFIGTQGQFLELIAVLVVQLIVFFLTGMYKTSFRTFGLRDALKIVKSAGFAVLTAHVFVLFVTDQPRQLDPLLLILNFYFLVSLVLGLRISFAALKILSRKDNAWKKQVLIYGADSSSLIMLQKILQDDDLDMSVLGFLDDTPQLEGKVLNGFPIFGGHWKLRKILQEKRVDEILVCSEYIKPEVLRRLTAISLEQKIPIKRPIIQMEELSQPAPVTRFPTPAVPAFAWESNSRSLGFNLQTPNGPLNSKG